MRRGKVTLSKVEQECDHAVTVTLTRDQKGRVLATGDDVIAFAQNYI